MFLYPFHSEFAKAKNARPVCKIRHIILFLRVFHFIRQSRFLCSICICNLCLFHSIRFLGRTACHHIMDKMCVQLKIALFYRFAASYFRVFVCHCWSFYIAGGKCIYFIINPQYFAIIMMMLFHLAFLPDHNVEK